MVKIIKNVAACLLCGEIVESEWGHDFKWCGCGKMAVDGGKIYLKRVGNPENIKEMSKTIEDV